MMNRIIMKFAGPLLIIYALITLYQNGKVKNESYSIIPSGYSVYGTGKDNYAIYVKEDNKYKTYIHRILFYSNVSIIKKINKKNGSLYTILQVKKSVMNDRGFTLSGYRITGDMDNNYDALTIKNFSKKTYDYIDPITNKKSIVYQKILKGKLLDEVERLIPMFKGKLHYNNYDTFQTNLEVPSIEVSAMSSMMDLNVLLHSKGDISDKQRYQQD